MTKKPHSTLTSAAAHSDMTADSHDRPRKKRADTSKKRASSSSKRTKAKTSKDAALSTTATKVKTSTTSTTSTSDKKSNDKNAKSKNAKDKNAKDKNAKDKNAKDKNAKDKNAKNKNTKNKHGKTKKKRLTAKTADRYDLYQRSVQDAVYETKLFRRMYKDARGKDKEPMILREDFSGTGWVSCEWTTRDPQRQSYAVDLDPTTHAWGKQHNLTKVSDEEQTRVHWILGDVRDTKSTPKADIVAATNFSYMIFKQRADLLEYFKCARANLKPDGIFVLDIFGGSEVYEDNREEEHGFKGFRYVWDQNTHNPINGDYLFHIHFDFDDGTRMKKAFSYDWRLWSLTEIQDLLNDAGFSNVGVYWENSDDEGEGTGVYRIRKRGDADLAWVSYVVAQR